LRVTPTANGDVDRSPPRPDGLRLCDIERAAVERTLAMTGNNRSEAARILCISRPTLLRKLKAYRAADAGLDPDRVS
jgi:DNA-binding NtrC family response regulator